MASNSTVDGPCCPERAEPGWPVPDGRAFFVLALVVAIFVLAAGPAAIAAWSIGDSGLLDRFYQSESAAAGLVLPWLQLPAQGVLVFGASLLPAVGAGR